ncbi:MAG: AmmeMemoRadiSam system protein B [Candidatus Kapabacteria bacterium]|nr:AmmeMemoRadiSam system protein B [Candidatus Kapabacteria bacterium]
MMFGTLPVFRADVQISVHQEDHENYLVLHDPFGFADGPIMVHADMLDVLQACDGETTLTQLAEAASEDPEGAQVTRLKLFLQQMDEMGYFEGAAYEALKETALAEWDSLAERPPICAGTTYPSEIAELREYLSTEMGIGPSAPDSTGLPTAVLLPHIDFRVAPTVYAPGLAPVAEHDADLVIMIGTSHYWGDDAFVLTEKSYSTPLGVVQTDVELVRILKKALPGVSATDIAHKPEHSLELHLVALQHLWQGKSFTVVPLLVTMAALEGNILSVSAEALRTTIEATGRKVLWLISGDLAHVGKKFGDDLPAGELLDRVTRADAVLLGHLTNVDLAAYHEEITENDFSFRICGHAPTMLALSAVAPTRGSVVSYDVWDEAETESAVSFATVLFH